MNTFAKAPISKQSGFTLIEMLLASVIFALVGLASFSILSAVLDSNDLSKETTLELNGVQRAFFWMERDFLQATKRQVRVDGEAASDKIFIGGDLIMESQGGAVAFTHDGWRNPAMILPRAEIQSVSYRMFEDKLERSFFNYPDPVTGEEPKRQILLENVESLAFEYYSTDGWGNVWEQAGLPRAVKIAIETKALGKIERIFLLTDNVAGAVASSTSSGARR
jgi:general secretion pathway protein J